MLIALALGLESATLQVAKRQDTTRALCISSFTAIEGNLVVPNNAKYSFQNGGT